MNSFLANLNRRLNRRGEPLYLRRTVGTSNQSYVQIKIPAIIQTLTEAQLIGNVTQTNYLIIISQTHIIAQQWPGGKIPASTGNIIASSDPRLPIVGDAVFFRGAQKTINRAAAIFDSGVCIRIDLTVTG